MDFAAILANNALARPVPNGFNGHIATVDVTHPSSFVDPANFICTNDVGHFDLGRSMAYAIFCAANRVAANPTPGHVEAAMRRIGNLISMHVILTVMSAANVDLTYRASDILTFAVFDTVFPDAGVRDAYITAATRVWAYLHEDANKHHLNVALVNSKYVVLALIANAIHRQKLNGHNWYTDKTNVQRTETGRCIAVAAEDRMAFGIFMSRDGHDLWHFLNDPSLCAVADTITGVNKIVINNDFIYNGINRRGDHVHTFIDVGDAAIDRWPPGQMGIASLMKGLDACSIMITDITSKVAISNTAAILVAIKRAKEIVSAKELGRPEMLTYKDSLTDLVCTSYGYVAAGQGLMATLGESDALSNLARSNAAATTRGSTAANRMREVTADVSAIGVMLKAVMDTIAAALSAIPGIDKVPETEQVVTANEVKQNTEQKLAEATRKANVAAAAEKIVDIGEDAFDRLENL